MTDNEKRAHDLAVAAAICNSLGSNDSDIYTLYKSAQDIAIQAVNRDFPAEK